jgi:metal-responsive CopG/Arc/MetJ family transcriptional regulator
MYSQKSDPKISIRIPKPLLAELDAAANRERYQRNRREGSGTRSSIVRRALNLYFNHRIC